MKFISISVMFFCLMSHMVFACEKECGERSPHPCDGAEGYWSTNQFGHPGGFIANTALVETTTDVNGNLINVPYIGPFVQVCDHAEVSSDLVYIKNSSIIRGNAKVRRERSIVTIIDGIVEDDAEVYSGTIRNGTIQGNAKVYGGRISGGKISGNAQIFEGWVSGEVSGDSIINSKDAEIYGKVTGGQITTKVIVKQDEIYSEERFGLTKFFQRLFTNKN